MLGLSESCFQGDVEFLLINADDDNYKKLATLEVRKDVKETFPISLNLIPPSPQRPKEDGRSRKELPAAFFSAPYIKSKWHGPTHWVGSSERLYPIALKCKGLGYWILQAQESGFELKDGNLIFKCPPIRMVTSLEGLELKVAKQNPLFCITADISTAKNSHAGMLATIEISGSIPTKGYPGHEKAPCSHLDSMLGGHHFYLNAIPLEWW